MRQPCSAGVALEIFCPFNTCQDNIDRCLGTREGVARVCELHGVSFFPSSPELRVRLQEAVFAPIILTRSVTSHSGSIVAEKIRRGRGREDQSNVLAVS